jgi:transcription antitermination factor NusG
VLEQPLDEGFMWIVVHVRPRCEKKMTRYCEQEGIDSYLPLKRTRHRYGKGRLREFYVPLFPGYIFCLLPEVELSCFRRNRYVANLLKVNEPDHLRKQLLSVARALMVSRDVEVMDHLDRGRAVRVAAGPFEGVEGVVSHRKGKTKVVINVDMIQQAVAVEVDVDLLEPA